MRHSLRAFDLFVNRRRGRRDRMPRGLTRERPFDVGFPVRVRLIDVAHIGVLLDRDTAGEEETKQKASSY